MFNLLQFLVLISCLNEALSVPSCEEMLTCHDCIRHANVCVWCASNDYNGLRCKPTSSNQTWCPEGFLENPSNLNKTSETREFSSHSKNVTQIRPQRFELKLRPGLSQDFIFSYKGAEDYPIDLYFLFDASISMTAIKTYTSEQSESIYMTMKNMTKDVVLGMGSFVDKNTFPFVTSVTVNQTYSFRHWLRLTEDYKKFKDTVDAVKSGPNGDIPEGGLDALAQAIVCKDQIGWRTESRKIIVFLTDAPYHTAGDGKSAGIFQPYDGKCYTNDEGVYTKELQMDYPSVSMINRLAKENEVIIIFATSFGNGQYIYESLSQAISGAEWFNIDTKKENGIVTTLKNIYEKVTKNIKLNVKMRSGTRKNFFSLTFDPDCAKDESACRVASGKEHKFTGTIKLLEYDGNNKAGVDITVEGINEKLSLDIEVINSCECEEHIEAKSADCNDEQRVCGDCKCSEKKYGAHCQCLRNKVNKFIGNTTCIGEGMNSSCSGRGKCFCGVCTCDDEKYTGRYCECEKNCPMFRDLTCGGVGQCQCDRKCECNEGRSGPACECDDTDENCRSKDTNKVCNDRGSCSCGSCKCNDIARWDKRNKQDDFCVVQPCTDCHDFQCTKLTECALCYLNNDKNCPDPDCPLMEATIVDELPNTTLDSDLSGEKWYLCTKIRVDVACYTNFTYMYDNDRYMIHLMLQKKKDCAEIYYLYGGIFLLSLLLVGIFTLVAWKLLTDARDRQEYLRFVKDHEDDGLGPCKNPLYEPATTTFRNPAFGKKSTSH